MELKKNPKYDLENKRPLFLSIGLVVALFCVTIAFNWRSEYDPLVIQPRETDFDEMPIIFNTKIEAPKPVLKKKKVKVIKPDISTRLVASEKESTELVEKLHLPLVDDPLLNFQLDYLPVEIVDEEPLVFVESMPEFPGGEAAFYAFLSSNMKYPSQARRMNVEGKVFVEFVIDIDGSVSDVKTVKGIGAGCDEEAARVLGMMPNFIPGKQRGRPVKVRMFLPVTFRLN
ncbi:MAG: protein TonB [Cyclobacteriaceae bacterium]|jgi:protein TonB